MDLNGIKANFLGDSITAGYGMPITDKDKIYLNVLKRECGLAEARNYGVSGSRIAPQPDDDNSYVERYQSMDDDADLVVVFGGTNDYGHGTAPIGTFDDRTPVSFYGSLHTLFSGLIEKYPKAEIVVMTPLHRETEAEPSANSGLVLRDYCEMIKQVAEYYAIPVLDLFATSLIQPVNPVQRERFCPDGLHPNQEGQRHIASRLRGFLQTL